MSRCASLVVATVLLLPATAAAASAPVVRAGEPNAVDGQYIVVMKDAADADATDRAQRTARAEGGRVRHEYSRALRGFSVKLSDRALAHVRSDPAVAYVEPDAVISIAATQSDATFGLDRIDQPALPLTSTYTYQQTGAGVTAYIIDTGIRTTHTQFGGRAVSGFDAVDALPADDCNGHGTHVAGTVGSADFGVAKGVRLVAVRVLDCNGSGLTSDVIAGVDYVTGNHAAGAPAVANMSLGGGASPALDNAVKSSIADGVTYVLAAGNDAADACGRSPGRVPAALTVGATNSADQEASFSNYGSCVDLLAPGVGITSTWSTSDVATNTISGTSMAAPHVAGVAALYLEQAPGASPATVHGAVVSGSTANSLDLYDGLGTPNRLVYSLIAPVTPPPPPPAPAPPAPPPAAVIEWTAPAAVINRTAPAAVIDGTAPAAALSGSKTQTLGRNVRVRVSCPDEACVVTAGGTVRVPTIGAMNAKAYKLKKTATAVTKGGKAMLAATLPSAAQAAIKRALRRGLRITVKLEITTADAAGNSTTLARQVKLKL